MSVASAAISSASLLSECSTTTHRPYAHVPLHEVQHDPPSLGSTTLCSNSTGVPQMAASAAASTSPASSVPGRSSVDASTFATTTPRSVPPSRGAKACDSGTDGRAEGAPVSWGDVTLTERRLQPTVKRRTKNQGRALVCRRLTASRWLGGSMVVGARRGRNECGYVAVRHGVGVVRERVDEFSVEAPELEKLSAGPRSAPAMTRALQGGSERRQDRRLLTNCPGYDGIRKLSVGRLFTCDATEHFRDGRVLRVMGPHASNLCRDALLDAAFDEGVDRESLDELGTRAGPARRACPQGGQEGGQGQWRDLSSRIGAGNREARG